MTRERTARRSLSTVARCLLLAAFAMSTSAAFARQATRPEAAGIPSSQDGAVPPDPSTQATSGATIPRSRAAGTLDLSPSVLKSAVDAADADYARTDTRSTFGAVTASQGIAVEPVWKAAEIDGCGKAQGALKFDPPVIGPVPLGGLLVAPYWLHAAATARCRI